MKHTFQRFIKQRRPVRFSGWLIPLAGLLVGVFLAIALAYNLPSGTVAPVMPQPGRSLTIAEPFSGQVFFNTEFGRSDFSQKLIAAIDAAHNRVDIAVYSLDHPGIRDALYRAARRGVAVTLILSDKQKAGHDRVLADLPANMARHDIATIQGSFNGTMHDKFMIVDRGTPQARLFFGSYNFTVLQEKFDPSFLLETNRPEIVTVFAEEFDRLLSGPNGQTKARAGANPFAARISYPQGYLEIWFGPQARGGGLRERLLGLISEARTSLDAMIWNLTDKGIAAALGDRAADSLPVRLLTDDTNIFGPDSALPELLARQKMEKLGSLEILSDVKRNSEVQHRFKQKDLNSFLHQHALIADGQTVIFGTGNWSAGGFYENDESAMVSDIPLIVNAFTQAFGDNYNKAR